MPIELKLDKSAYNLGDIIRASLTVTNHGAKPVAMPEPALDISSVSFRLHRADGTHSVIARMGKPAASRQVQPAAALSGEIELIAIEPGELRLEAVYNPRGRIDPTLQSVQAETSKPVQLRVSGGKQLQVKLTTEAGPIVLEFFPRQAHNHALSMVELVSQGYYNGISFHRIVPGFVIQGGDPTGTGGGGPGYKLAAEFNEILHDEGILSMARTSDPHSAGSQFFICLSRERTAGLDRQYTVFGKVVAGLEAVREIGATESNAGRFHMKKAEVVLA